MNSTGRWRWWEPVKLLIIVFALILNSHQHFYCASKHPNPIFSGLTPPFEWLALCLGRLGFYCLPINQRRAHLISSTALPRNNKWCGFPTALIVSVPLHVWRITKANIFTRARLLVKQTHCGVAVAFVPWKQIYPDAVATREPLWGMLSEGFVLFKPRTAVGWMEGWCVGVAIAKGGAGFLEQSLSFGSWRRLLSRSDLATGISD